MISTCHSCGSPVDPLRNPARIVAARIVSLCGLCASHPIEAAERARRAAEAAVAGEAFVSEVYEDDDDEQASWRARFARPRKLPTLVATGAIAAAMLLWSALAPSVPRRLLGHLESHAEAASPPGMSERPALLPPGPQLPGAVETVFVHPLPGVRMLLPLEPMRRFGADRDGLGRARGCGHGHCGVDIGERIGAPVVSVADGIVAKVVRYDNPNGGLYVRVDHPDGTSSFYFHLHSIRRDLKPGMAVSAGEAIATLGRSGILHSPAHLHFAFAQRQGEHDHYIDPEPFLRDSVLLAAPTSGDVASMSGPEAAPRLRTDVPEAGALHADEPAAVPAPAGDSVVETPGIAD